MPDKENGEGAPPRIAAVAYALHRVRRAREAEDDAASYRQACERTLADLMGARRRDKDMGFDAEHEAERVLIDYAIDAHLAESDAKSETEKP